MSNGHHEASEDSAAKVFRDPIHDLIYLEPSDRWALDLIDCKEFQRLRRIKQLGLANLVYPGAEHSRFTHSLGVFNFARRIIRKLKHRHKGTVIEDHLQFHERIIKAAALLHDLGHGPFSHVFERAFKNTPKGTLAHDEWSCQIIGDSETEVFQVLKDHDLRPEEISCLISDSAGSPPEPYLKDIVSSQLDADRMDYLLRDSWMTGSEYGRFDSEWILNALAIGEISQGETPVKKLCVDATKGTGAIEAMLFARSLMLQHVYGHKATRAYEAELLQTIRLANDLGTALPDDTPSPIQTLLTGDGPLSTKEYLALDDEVLWWALRRFAAWKDEDLPKGDKRRGAESLRRHSLRLVRRQKPWRFVEIPQDNFIQAQYFLRGLQKDHPNLVHECYLDDLKQIPYSRFSLLSSADEEEQYFGQIFLLTKSGPKPISDIESPFLKAFVTPWRTSRFYFDPLFTEEFSGLLKKFGVC